MKNTGWLKATAVNPNAQLRLFCFPYAGGAASAFVQWRNHMPPGIDVCPVQLPGREDRIAEPPFEDLDRLVSALIRILPPYMDVPFAFFGHSMGTLIAFELARALRRSGYREPEQMFVSGRCAPQVPDPDPCLHQLPDVQFIEGLRAYNGTPEAVLQNRELMDMLIPLLRADFRICETYAYRPEPPLECPISAYAGAEEASRHYLDGWRHQTTSAFHSKVFPGGHFFLHTERPRLLRDISSRLLDMLVN